MNCNSTYNNTWADIHTFNDTQISRMYIHIHSHGTTRCKQRRLELNQLSLGGTRKIHAKASVVVRERRRVGYRRLQKELSRIWWGPWSLICFASGSNKASHTDPHHVTTQACRYSLWDIGVSSWRTQLRRVCLLTLPFSSVDWLGLVRRLRPCRLALLPAPSRIRCPMCF